MKAASFDTFSEPEPESVTLSFGKHRGKALADVESSYLEWVLTADRITPELKAAITIELSTRAPRIPDRWKCPSKYSESQRLMAEWLVSTGYDELLAVLGPDNDLLVMYHMLKQIVDNIVTFDGGPVI